MRALLFLATLLRRLVDPEPTHSRYKPNHSERSLLEGPRVSKASENRKRAQNRRLWIFFRSMTGKYRLSKGQEAWQRQRAKDKVKLVSRLLRVRSIEKWIPVGGSIKIGETSYRIKRPSKQLL